MTNLELKNFHNKTVSIVFRDGEVATARLTCTTEDCGEVLVDILGTNCPGRYNVPMSCSYTVPITDIVSVVVVSAANPAESAAHEEAPEQEVPAAA